MPHAHPPVQRVSRAYHRDMLTRMKAAARRVPIVGAIAFGLWRRSPWGRFSGSAGYWESRYAVGGTSGAGSYGRLAAFKAEVLNRFVDENAIESLVEFGCGDGNQLTLAAYPNYVGLDVSRSAIRMCMSRFPADRSKSFFIYDSTCFLDNAGIFAADASLSIDVLFHLVEDEVFETYMAHLFSAARRHVVIYSSDVDIATSSPHERHRNFTGWIAENQPGWKLVRRIPNRYPSGDEDANGSASDFYIYAHEATAPEP